jgi:hypothetical protein
VKPKRAAPPKAKRAAPSKPKAKRSSARHVAVRLDPEVIDRIDALLADVSSAWIAANRSDVLRKVILSGLRTLEARARATPGRRRAKRAAAPKPD